MTTQTTSLFVYGTLKRGHRLNSILGGGSTLIYPAITLLNNYDLQGYADAFPIMTLTEEGEGYRVLGELYRGRCGLHTIHSRCETYGF